MTQQIIWKFGACMRAVLMAAACLTALKGATAQPSTGDVFAADKLAAWCIVPFDAAQRTPEARAKMLSDLGISKLAYDWREEHIPLFDREWKALRENGVELFAFWLPSNTDPANEAQVEQVFAFLERNRIKTQLWYLPGWFTGYENQVAGFDEMTREEQVESISKPIRYVAERARALGCTVGLYNHGGWFGEPENQIAIIEHLGMDNVGMVYNFQHGRHHIHRFPEFYPKIQKYLLCINLVGLADGDPVTVTALGEGDIEYGLLETIYKSGYTGPISIQNHRADRDAEAALITERKGLEKMKAELTK
ncbi:sugar phosphate isomerase/epimerase family protein [Parapedobacter sp.]